MAAGDPVWNYVLRGHRGEVVYKGITNDPDAREQEHWDDGKDFARLETVGNSKPRNEARRDERRTLAREVERHGRQPKYNKKRGGLARYRRPLASCLSQRMRRRTGQRRCARLAGTTEQNRGPRSHQAWVATARASGP